MNVWLKRGLQLGLFAGAVWFFGTQIASADTPSSSDPASAATSPSQGPAVDIGIAAPVNVSGNSVNVLGGQPATASSSQQDATSGSAASGSSESSGADVPVTTPVNVCGNGVGVLGEASAGCTGGTTAAMTGGGSRTSRSAAGPEGTTSTATVADAPVATPVTVCGNGAGVLGDASAGCTGGTTAATTGRGTTTFRSAALVAAPVTAPVTACGNAVGTADATCSTAATGPGGTTDTAMVADAPVAAPVMVCGNGAGVLGDASASCGQYVATPQPGGSTPPTGNPPAAGAGVDAVTASRGTSSGLSPDSAAATRLLGLASTGMPDAVLLTGGLVLVLAGATLLVSAGRRPQA